MVKSHLFIYIFIYLCILHIYLLMHAPVPVQWKQCNKNKIHCYHSTTCNISLYKVWFVATE